MKFIVLNAHFQQSAAAAKLKSQGVHLLFCADLREADMVLKIHGRSIDLMIGHDEDGLQLNKIAKSNPKLAPIPVIMSFSKWSNDQCVEHQAGPASVNAYLRIPIEDSEWIRVVDTVIGTSFQSGQRVGTQAASEAIAEGNAPGPVAGLKIENAESVYTKSEPDQKGADSSEGGISLGDIFGGSDLGGALETSGLKGNSFSPPPTDAEVQAEAVDLLSIDLGNANEIPVADPVENSSIFGNSKSMIDFQLDDLGAPPEGGPHFTASVNNPAKLAPSAESESFDLNADPVLEIGGEIPSFSGQDSLSLGGDQERTSPTMDFQSGAQSLSLNESLTPDDHQDVDADALVEMPYLSNTSGKKRHSALQTHVALDDALVPGGSANPPDTDTLKKYLSLRELDVATLSQQLHQSKDYISKLENELKKEKSDTTALNYLVSEQETQIKNFDKEKQIALESANTENQELKFEMKKRMDKIRLLEIQVREATQEAEKIKDRVRGDIRKIRSREKELENRLEIMRKDSEALLAARENRIIELKRKLDLIEFNMDILQNQYEKEKQLTSNFKEKLEKAAQVVRVAEGLLHPSEQIDLGDILTQDLGKEEKTRVA
jgi:hypothetical protein